MRANKCFICGSSNLRADRALSGRLICASCGNLYGLKRVSSNNVNLINNSFISNNLLGYSETMNLPLSYLDNFLV